MMEHNMGDPIACVRLDEDLAYITGHDPNSEMLRQFPRVRQMVQTPSAPLDHQQTAHAEDVCHKKLNTSLQSHPQQHVDATQSQSSRFA